MNLYHVTPSYNVQSIFTEGVSPHYSRGKQRVAWWASGENLMWALAHISRRYAMSTLSLAVFQADIPDDRLIKTAWRGVYQLREPFTVKSVNAAANIIDDTTDGLELLARIDSL